MGMICCCCCGSGSALASSEINTSKSSQKMVGVAVLNGVKKGNKANSGTGTGYAKDDKILKAKPTFKHQTGNRLSANANAVATTSNLLKINYSSKSKDFVTGSGPQSTNSSPSSVPPKDSFPALSQNNAVVPESSSAGAIIENACIKFQENRPNRLAVGSEVLHEVLSATKLFQDQTRKTTFLGEPIVQTKNRHLLTREKLQSLRSNPDLPADTRTISAGNFAQLHSIVDGIYLTGVFGLETSAMASANIALVVNATNEVALLKVNSIPYSIRVPVADDPNEPIGDYFEDVSDLMETVRRKGYGSVVHCMAGVSRSATLVLAYLLKYTNLNLYDAFRHTKAIRGCIRPNMGFFRQLIEYETKMRGASSVTMVDVIDKKTGVTVNVPHFYQAEYPELYKVELLKQRKANDKTSTEISAI